MEIANPWVIFVSLGLLALAVIGVVLASLWTKRQKQNFSDSLAPVVNSARLTSLPIFSRKIRSYQFYLTLTILLGLVFLSLSTFLASRPISKDLVSAEKYNRDIVLCLDISGSMTAYDSALLTKFEQLTNEFKGERIGLVLWNSSAVQIFPLTDDYQFAVENIRQVREGMDGTDRSYLYFAGTNLGEGSSLIGDGLASCLMRFDNMDSDRSRSIIFATDNFTAGEELVSLPEAALIAKELKIKVYGIDTNSWSGMETALQFRQAVETTGGSYFSETDTSMISTIVNRITAEQAAGMEAPGQWAVHDEPETWMLLCLAGFLVYLAASWRVKL